MESVGTEYDVLASSPYFHTLCSNASLLCTCNVETSALQSTTRISLTHDVRLPPPSICSSHEDRRTDASVSISETAAAEAPVPIPSTTAAMPKPYLPSRSRRQEALLRDNPDLLRQRRYCSPPYLNNSFPPKNPVN